MTADEEKEPAVSNGGEYEDEDDEDDEEEPLLKYSTINQVKELLSSQRDDASCMTVMGEFIAIGTHNGILHLFTLDGTRIKSTRPHSASIHDVVLVTGFVGTASMDGLVSISTLPTLSSSSNISSSSSTPNIESYAIQTNRPARTLALHPSFSSLSSRPFVTGGMAGILALHERSWTGSHRQTVIHQGEGTIWNVRWCGNLIAWANEKGVKVYDTVSQARITFIERPIPPPRAKKKEKRKSQSQSSMISEEKEPYPLTSPVSPTSPKPSGDVTTEPEILKSTSTHSHPVSTPSNATSPSKSNVASLLQTQGIPSSFEESSGSESESESDTDAEPAEPPPADIYRPILHWSNPETLIIAWVDVIKVARVRPREQPTEHPLPGSGRETPTPRANTPATTLAAPLSAPTPETAAAHLQGPANPLPNRARTPSRDQHLNTSASVATAGAGMLNALTFGLAPQSLLSTSASAPTPIPRIQSPARGQSPQRPSHGTGGTGNGGTKSKGRYPPLRVEITSILQLEGMIAGFIPRGIIPRPESAQSTVNFDNTHGSMDTGTGNGEEKNEEEYLVLTFTPPKKPRRERSQSTGGDGESFAYKAEGGRVRGRKIPSNPVELKVITRHGEEISADVLTTPGYAGWGCNNYMLVGVPPASNTSNSSASTTAPAGGLGAGLGGLTGFGLGFGFGGHEKSGSSKSTSSASALTSTNPSTVTTSQPERLSSQSLSKSALKPLAMVLTPSTLITVLPLSRRDRIQWREEKGDYEVALGLLGVTIPEVRPGKLRLNGFAKRDEEDGELERWGVHRREDEEGWEEDERRRIGRAYIEVLLDSGEYEKAAKVAGLVLPSTSSSLSATRNRTRHRNRTQDSEKDVDEALFGDDDSEERDDDANSDAVKKEWEEVVWLFAERGVLKTLIPYIPTSPRMHIDSLVYGMILAHFLTNDPPMLLKTIQEWPKELYDPTPLIIALRSSLPSHLFSIPQPQPTSISSSHTTSSSFPKSSSQFPTSTTPTENEKALMRALAILYQSVRQPSNALPLLLSLRDKESFFQLVKEFALWNALIGILGRVVELGGMEAVEMFVGNVAGIPVGRVVDELRDYPKFLFHYLDELSILDPHLTSDFADHQVELYARFAPERLIAFLRASNYFNLEKAYKVCEVKNLITEMVFLLGRMGNNRKALQIIIEKIGDVNRAIDFAKEQNDPDLWEDLLTKAESSPRFIKGLLMQAGGSAIDPLKLIQRIRDGLEIPGLRDALIKILTDYTVQISLLDGCGRILESDCSRIGSQLMRGQQGGFFQTPDSKCDLCGLQLYDDSKSVVVMFLCRITVHQRCVELVDADDLPEPTNTALTGTGLRNTSIEDQLTERINCARLLKTKMTKGCLVHTQDNQVH